MFKAETDVIHWIYSFTTHQKYRTLDHLHGFLQTIDNPHLKLKTVHVAGTNGKGSTVSYMRQAFMEAGYKVATFTSPYIICFGERMSINNQAMSSEMLVHYGNQLKTLLPKNQEAFTSFDIITFLSYLYFSDEAVDIAIYETGIGGRLDATNVIMPLATAITNVGHDHADVLGETQLARAKEKLGIVKHSVPLFTTETDATLLQAFKKVTQQNDAEIFDSLADASLLHVNETGVCFKWGEYDEIKITMHGVHQFKNASLAVSILHHLKKNNGYKNLDATAISNTKWQGRFEAFETKNGVIVLDGAHNKEGILALIDTVKCTYPTKKPLYLFSAIATKDAKEMIHLLEASGGEVVVTTGSHLASINPQLLKTYIHHHPQLAYDDFKDAIHILLSEKVTECDIMVVCGSLYFISEVREHLLKTGGHQRD